MIALLAPVPQPAEPEAFVIEPGRVYSYKEIAAVIGCSDERVRQIEKEALRKLRRRSVSLWTLREYWAP